MRGIVIFISVLVCSTSLGQQLPQYSQWSWHQFAGNPAHAGIKKCVDIHMLYRLQWVGIEGAPRSGFATVSVPLSTKRRRYLSARHGMGVKFETDGIGQFSANRFNLAYAGHFNFNKNDRLSLGVYAGILQTGYDPTTATTINPDPAVQAEASFISPDASFGAWFNSENYYVGLTLQNLISSRWDGLGTEARYRFHTTLNGGYRIGIGEQITLLPGFKVRFPPRGPVSLDLQMMCDYRNIMSFGLGYRNTDAVMAYFQFKVKEQFSIGYSFDYTTSDLQILGQNTHEISLRFMTCKPQRTGTTGCSLFE